MTKKKDLDKIVFGIFLTLFVLGLAHIALKSEELPPAQLPELQVTKAPVLVEFLIHPSDIPFEIAIFRDDEFLMKTNNSTVILENGHYYRFVIYNERYWYKEIDKPIYLDIECKKTDNCTYAFYADLSNKTYVFFIQIPVVMEKIQEPRVVYFDNKVCILNKNNVDIPVTVKIYTYAKARFELSAVKHYDAVYDWKDGKVAVFDSLILENDYKCIEYNGLFDNSTGIIKNVTIEIPNLYEENKAIWEWYKSRAG